MICAFSFSKHILSVNSSGCTFLFGAAGSRLHFAAQLIDLRLDLLHTFMQLILGALVVSLGLGA